MVESGETFQVDQELFSRDAVVGGYDRVSTIRVSGWVKEATENTESSLFHSLTRMVLTPALTDDHFFSALKS
jgi:hypothetical protein